jgi:hypothetical protein
MYICTYSSASSRIVTRAGLNWSCFKRLVADSLERISRPSIECSIVDPDSRSAVTEVQQASDIELIHVHLAADDQKTLSIADGER